MLCADYSDILMERNMPMLANQYANRSKDEQRIRTTAETSAYEYELAKDYQSAANIWRALGNLRKARELTLTEGEEFATTDAPRSARAYELAGRKDLANEVLSNAHLLVPHAIPAGKNGNGSKDGNGKKETNPQEGNVDRVNKDAGNFGFNRVYHVLTGLLGSK